MEFDFTLRIQARQASGREVGLGMAYKKYAVVGIVAKCVPRALFASAQIQSEAEDYLAADISLRNFIARFPNHELTPAARYLLGQNLEKQKKYTDAARVYRNLDLLHPKSDYAEAALERLDQLAKKTPLAGYEARRYHL